jgi:hypothetical protein
MIIRYNKVLLGNDGNAGEKRVRLLNRRREGGFSKKRGEGMKVSFTALSLLFHCQLSIPANHKF